MLEPNRADSPSYANYLHDCTVIHFNVITDALFY